MTDSAARQGVGTCAVCGGWPRHLATLNPCRCTAVIEPNDSAARQVNAQATPKRIDELFDALWAKVPSAEPEVKARHQQTCRIWFHYGFEAASVPAPAPSTEPFNEDMIARTDIPRDVFGLIHDLAYDHKGRERFQYRSRAQKLLMSANYCGNCDCPCEVCGIGTGEHCGNPPCDQEGSPS